MSTRNGSVVIGLTAALLLGCGSGGSESIEEFIFESSRTVDLSLSVRGDESPLRGAKVQVVDHLRAPWPGENVEDLVGGDLYFQGFTDEEGRCQGLVKLPSIVRQVDVIVQAPGYEGSYTVPFYKELWGPFAPSTRSLVPTSGLSDLAINLVSE